jgi:hypothetical protein
MPAAWGGGRCEVDACLPHDIEKNLEWQIIAAETRGDFTQAHCRFYRNFPNGFQAFV